MPLPPMAASAAFPPGKDGRPGIPGPGAVPADEAVAAYIETIDTFTQLALNGREEVRGAKFFVHDEDPAGGSVATQATVAKAHAAWVAGFGGTVVLPAGDSVWTSQITIPSFTTTGNAWDEQNPIRIVGLGANITRVRYTGSDPYAIAHATINGTSNRGQNFGVEISDFTLTGPQDFANPANGIGIDNTRFPAVHHMAIRGFPGGVGIHLYGHQKGGTFQARIHDNMFGTNIFRSSGSESLYHPDDLEQWSMRYCIRLDGPYASTGKVNDVDITRNRCVDFLIGAISIDGHGSWTGGTNTGGCANINSSKNVFFSEAGRKMEEGGTTPEVGTLSAVTSTTVMRLKAASTFTVDDAINGWLLYVQNATTHAWEVKTISDYTGSTKEVTLAGALGFTPTVGTKYRLINPTNGLQGTPTTTVLRLRANDCLDTVGPAVDLTGKTLAVRDPDGIWRRRYIQSWNAATRTATLATALPFTPVAGDNYRVGYADAAARAIFTDPTTLQHAFYWASSYSCRSTSDYFEETIPVAAHLLANSDFTVVNPEDTVNDTRYGMRVDGSVWHPRLSVSDRPRGSDAVPATIFTQGPLYGHPENYLEPYGAMGRTINNTGARVYVGDVVRLASSNIQASASSTSGSVTSVHVVVASDSREFFEAGAEMSFALNGMRPVRVSAGITAGDLLLPATSNKAIGQASSTATGEQAAEALGRALQNASSGALVLAMIRGW